MNQVQFLHSQIADLPAQASELEMETLVATYLTAKEQMEHFAGVGADAKRRVAQIIEFTGQSEWATASGKVIVPAPGLIISYDAHALDALRASNRTLNRLIFPHRSETLRSGGIRITGYER